MQSHLWILSWLLAVVCLSVAHDGLQETTWGAVVYTVHGDSTPIPFWRPKSLTPLGAHQLYSAGSAIRSHFVSTQTDKGAGPSGQISGISEYPIRNDQIEVFSTTDGVIHPSAQAFMQGLYPPSASMYDNTVLVDNSAMVNGTAIEYPLKGYQYPNITTFGPEDPASIHLTGHVSCPNYAERDWNYFLTDDAEAIVAETGEFYDYLYRRILHPTFSNDTVHFYNAHIIFDYLNYESIHNETARGIIDPDMLRRARYLASRRIYEANANTTAISATDDPQSINSVAGMTLVYSIAEALDTSILSQGEKKLSLFFGGVEPIMSLFSLLGLTSGLQRNFYGLPNPGASLVIELFTQASDPSVDYPPNDEEFMVRVFLRNETDPWNFSADLVPYSMFGLGTSQVIVPYKEFVAKLVDISMPVPTWCRVCGSQNEFCIKYKPPPPPPKTPREVQIMVYLAAGIALCIVFMFVIACVCTRYPPSLCRSSRRSRARSRRRPGFNRLKTFSPPKWTPAWLGKKRSQDPGSWEMDTSTRACTNASTSFSEGGSPQPSPRHATVTNEEDDDEILINPATQPAKIREIF